MSRIFDALQRLESERTGEDSATLPQGPELLQRAEHRVATGWETNGSHSEVDVVRNSQDEALSGVATSSPADATSGMSVAQGPSKVKHSDLLKKVPSLKILLSPQSRLVCLTDRENPTAEAIRLTGVRLRDLRRSRPLKKVLITSTIPQEGKSTISANLACALAQASDEKILLVEGDLRRPSLLQMFGIEKKHGISECVRDEGRELAGIYHLKEAGFWILPAGQSPSNPLELLQSQRLHTLIDQLSTYFDWIIIDSPPVLPLADTSIWMRLADGILLVTRQGTTQKHQLEKGLEALDRKKMLGALLNGSIASAYSSYYYNSPGAS